MKRLGCLIAALFFSRAAPAQPAPAGPPGTAASGVWDAGLGVGNGLEIHAGYRANRLMLLGRTRYKWWRPDTGPGSSGLFREFNTRSRQTEAAVLAGYSVLLSGALLYAGAGVGYVKGRQLTQYRYTLRSNAFIGGDTHYYAYRRYQAIGLPLEAGLLFPAAAPNLSLGVTFQANLNPEQTVFCLLFTLWGGRFGRSLSPAQ